MAIQIRNEPAQHIGVVNSAPCPEMNIVAKEITENGRYEARTEGATGFDPVIVNVPSREEIGYENGYADGYAKGETDGFSDALAKRTEIEITANGEYIPDGESTGFSKVSVNLPSDTDTIDGLISGTLSGHYRNDSVTMVGEYGLCAKKNLTSVDFPNVTTLSTRSISKCDNLKSINLPMFKSITAGGSNYMLADNTLLQSVYLPKATNIGGYCFYNDYNLSEVYLPLLNTVGASAFQRCDSLESLNLPSVNFIDTYAFRQCYQLKKLVLSYNTHVAILANTNAFLYCYRILGTVSETYNPEGLKDGYIYVPDDLVEQYKVATNWSTYASQIKPISELEE